MKSSAVRLLSVGAIAMMGMVASISANHAWGPYHWARTQNPLTLKVGDNVSATWDASLDVAIADWNQSIVLDLTKTAGGARSKNCRPTSGRIEVCSGAYGNNGWLGIAQIWVTGGEHITQATTKLNDYYFAMAQYNTPAWRALVTCQEVGHDFGLTHQDENFNNPNLGTCMDYTNNPATNQHPNQHDYDELVTIYSHFDNFTTAGALTLPAAMPPAMGQIDFDSPGQWGRLVHSAAGGRAQVYDVDFGRGNHVITHVFWADPQADAR
jgi:hypothetical protein